MKRSSVSKPISTREVFLAPLKTGDGRATKGRVTEARRATAPTEDVQALDADLDEAVDQVEAADADGESQENLRRIREEFKARAEEAALRVKLREAELHEAASSSDAER